jgi:hypothetical protein
VPRTLSNQRLKDTPASALLALVEEITGSVPVDAKLRYAEMAMSENLKKEYEALPPTTRRCIDSIQTLCDLFLSNKVTMSKAPTMMTLRPAAIQGDELAANLQFLTNLQLANGYSATSNTDLLERCLTKQFQFAGVNQMAASQNPEGLNTLGNDELITAFVKANKAFFSVRAPTSSEATHLLQEGDDEATKSDQTTLLAKSTETKCGGACSPPGQCLNAYRSRHLGNIPTPCRPPKGSEEYRAEACSYTGVGQCRYGGDNCHRIHFKEEHRAKWERAPSKRRLEGGERTGDSRGNSEKRNRHEYGQGEAKEYRGSYGQRTVRFEPRERATPKEGAMTCKRCMGIYNTSGKSPRRCVADDKACANYE